MSCKIRKGPLVAVSVLIRLIYLLCFFTTRPTESVTIQPFRIQQINLWNKSCLQPWQFQTCAVYVRGTSSHSSCMPLAAFISFDCQTILCSLEFSNTVNHPRFGKWSIALKWLVVLVSQGCSRIPTHKNQITTTTTTTAEGRWTDNWDGQIQLKQWGFSRAPSLLWCDIVSQWNSNEHLYLQILRDRQHLVLSYLRLRTSLAAFLLFSHEGVNYVWGIGAIS